MPELWMPGAEIHDIGDHAPTDTQYPPKAIAHITWDKNATLGKPQDWVSFDNLVAYFTGQGAGAAPHIIWDPFTGRIAQLFPADSRSKSVVDLQGNTRTNRAGKVVIQVEAVFFPYCRYNGTVYPQLVDTPCAGWDRLHAWIRSWGVPDEWPMGRPTNFQPNRNEHTWETVGGWYGHSQVPENDHQDPGSWPLFNTTVLPPPPQDVARYQVVINGLAYGYGATGDHITAVGVALVQKGYGQNYKVGPGPVWGDSDTLNYSNWQKSLGYSGADADGVPGEASLVALLGYLPGGSVTTVSLAHVVSAAQTDPAAEQGHQTYGPEVTTVENALVAEGLLDKQWVDGSYGSKTVDAYAAWQRRCGYTGTDADGIPGKTSLTRLGTTHGFTVTT